MIKVRITNNMLNRIPAITANKLKKILHLTKNLNRFMVLAL